MPLTAELLVAAMQTLGNPYPRDRKERQTRLETVSEDILKSIDRQFFVEIRNENGGFDSAIRTFVQTNQ